ncbi:MAG: hypothetical protein AB1798_05600, partial [Spirochaetota bacterium]
MKRKKNLDIILILRILSNSSDIMSRIIKECLNLVGKYLPGQQVGLHWNFPCYPLLEEFSTESEKIVTKLMSRVTSGEDVLLPMGYAGSIHPYLLEDELIKEIEWCIKNQWKSGLKDVFGIEPEILMPLYTDYARNSIRQIYLESRYKAVLSFTPNRFTAGILQINRGDAVAQVPCITVTDPDVQKTRKKLKKECNQAKKPLFLLVDFLFPEDTCKLQGLLETIKRLSDWRITVRFDRFTDYFSTISNNSFLALPDSGSNTVPAWVLLPQESFFTNPKERIFQLAAGRERLFQYRRSGGIKDEGMLFEDSVKNILLRLVNSRHGPTPLVTIPAVFQNQQPDRLLIANMPGSVMLKENDVEVQFKDGKFADIIVNTKPALTGRRVRSFLTIRKKPVFFSQTSTFSFEGERTRGLRDFSSLDSPFFSSPGNLMVDYFFIDKFPNLIVALYIRYPLFRSGTLLTSYALFEIPVFQFNPDESIHLEGEYPDGRNYTLTLPPAEHTYELSGTRFFLTKNELSFMI